MLKQFLNHINSNNLCSSSDKVLLAVSGGLDSMVMLSLFKEAGFNIAVAHCNFQLRGEESNGDESFVKQTCEDLVVPIYVNRFDTEKYSIEHGLSIQMGARELRYRWFKQLMEQEGFTLLATAHHLNDSIETSLLNWLHGSSLDGFVGIPVKNNSIIRPLLFATKAQLNDYATEKNLVWREDSSNFSDDYQRNFIRHQIIPRFKEVNPSLEETFIAGQQKISDELSYLNSQYNLWKINNLKINGDVVSISKQELTHITLLWRSIREFGFNFWQCKDAMNALTGQSGKRFLSSSHQMVIDRDEIFISPSTIMWEDVIIERNSHSVSLGDHRIAINNENTFIQHSNRINATLDADKLVFPLRWRLWKQGDFFYPLGMENKKKLSDFFIDNKVPISEKNRVTVLESNGQIIWVVGHRIDNRFRVTPETKSFISFEVIP